MSNTALDNIRVRIAPATNVKVRVQDNGSLQSVTPVTLKNAIGQNVTLTELYDVTITDPANSQILAYQSNTSQWINRTATTIAGNTGQIVVANNNAFDFNLSLSNTVVVNQSLNVNTQFSTNSTGTYINNGFFGNVNISNTTILTGTLQLRNIIPDANNAYTIGNNTNRFATLYLSGNTLYMGNVVFTDVNTSLSLTSSNGSPIAVSMGNTAVNGSLSVSTSFSANSLNANTLTINQTSNLAGNVVVGNSALFVDAANNKVGINTNTPEFDFQIVTERDPGGIILDTYTTTGAPNVKMRRARGSRATPAPVQLNDNLGTINGTGYVDGLGFPSLSKVAIQMFSTEAHTNTGMGTRIVFSTTNTASNTRSDRFVVGGNATVNTAITAFDIIGFRANAYFDQTIFVGANLTLNTSSISIGNSIANTFANSTAIVVSRISATNVATTNLQVTDTIAGNNMTLSGNLTVSGTTTYINTTALNVGDNIITLNADVTNVTAPTENAGIEINRGSLANVSFLWDETLDTWSQGNTTVAGYVNASSVNVTGSATVNGALTVNNTASFGNTTITGFVNASSVNVTGAATVNGALIVNNTASFGNTTITGFANVVGNVNITNTLTSANLFANALSTNTFTTNLISVTTPATTANIAPTTGIAGWNYSGKFKSIGTEESAPTGLFLSPDGLNMYVNGTTGDDVNQYTLSTAWDVSTATFVRLFSTAAQDSAPADIFFKPDGLSMFIVGTTNDTVFQYTLSSAFDISTASYASKSFSVASQEITPNGLWFKPDGTVMYVIGSTSDTVHQYTLGTAWDVSTASYASISFSVASQESGATQVNLSANGLTMWVLGSTGDDISEYALGTAWNVSTATFVNNFYVGFQDTGGNGLFIDSTAADRVYIVGGTNDTVFQYNTATNSISAVTDVFNTTSNARVQGNLAVQSNAYVDGTLAAQGTTTLGTTSIGGTLTASSTITLQGTTTSTTALGTAATTGTTTIGGASQTGAIVVGQSTLSQTANIQAGATASGSTKTLNIGTAGLSGSITNLTLGSAVSGATTNTLLYSNTFIVTGGNTHLGGLIGGEAFRVIPTVNSNNYLQVAGAVTGAGPTLSAQGVDTNIGINITGKGTGVVNISPSINVPGSATVNGAFVVNNTASLGNTTVTGFVNATASVNSAILSVGTSFIANSTGAYHTGTVNAASHTIGTTFIANTTGAYHTGLIAANGSITAHSGLDGQIFLGDSVNGAIELGRQGRGSGGTPYIDFHSSVSSPDYDVRIIALGGNTTSGSGNLSINANVVNLPNTVITGTIATGNATITGFVNATASVNSAILSVGTAVIANSTGITTTGFVNAAGVVNAASHTVGTSFIANSTGVTTTGFANVGGRIVGNLGGADANTFAGFGLDINSAVIRVGDGQNSLTMANGTGFKIHDSGNSHKSIGQLGSTFYISDTSADGNSLFPATRTDIFAANTSLATLGVNTSITGFINVSSTANVGGAITARGDVTVNGALTVANTAALGNTTITGFINVSSTANIGGALTARGAVTVNGALIVANTAALGNTTITGDATVTANLTANNVRTTGSVQIDGDLTVSGNTITIGVTNLAVSDNIIYLNEPETATVTSATSNGTAFIYTALNGFNVGQVVTVTGMTPGGYNAAANTITAANSTSFAVANTTAPGAYVSGGSAVARVDTNPDVGFAANYNDGTYRHAGFFRDATDGVFKVFDQYQPEPSGAFIDTSNNTFRIADFQSNNTLLGTANVAGTTRIGTGLANYIQLAGSSAANWTTLSTQGTDTNIDISYFTKGSGNHTFASGGVNNNIQFRVAHTASSVNYLQATGAATGSGPTISAQGSDANVDVNITSKGTGAFSFNVGSAKGLYVYSLGSAPVNYWSAAPNDTGQTPYLYAQGSDTNVSGSFSSKGTGALYFRTNGGNQTQFLVTHTASAVNYIQTTGAATGVNPVLSAQGSDTNIGLTFSGKGTGHPVFTTATAVGGTATNTQTTGEIHGLAGNVLILRSSLVRHTTGSSWTGTGYRFGLVVDTTAMSYIEFNPVGQSQGLAVQVAAGAPFQVKTAGGEQFRVADTASAVNYIQASGAATGVGVSLTAQGSDTNVAFSLAPKGSGILYLGGGQTRIAANNYNVLFLGSSGVAVNYTQLTAAATGFSPSFIARGSDTNIGLNFGTLNDANIDFYASGDPNAGTGKLQLRIAPVASAVNYIQLAGAATAGAPYVLANGSDTNVPLILSSKGAGSIQFKTAGATPTQFLVAHTASAVNYIQVAGNVTGQQPFFLSAGSDTDVGITYATKGTGSHFFSTGGGTLYQFEITSTASAVNYIRVTGAATGGIPVVSAQGTDTNVTLGLSSKGTGAVRFNTGGGEQVRIIDVASADTPWFITGGRAGVQGNRITGLSPSFQSTDSAPIGFRTNAGTSGGLGTEQFRVAHTGSAINYLQITGAATGSGPILSAQGSDTNVDLNITTKGTGAVNFNTGNGRSFQAADLGVATVDYIQTIGATGVAYLGVAGTSANISTIISSKGIGSVAFYTNGAGNTQQFRINHTASAVNYLEVTGGATGSGPVLRAIGTDANVPVNITAKAAGNINLNSNTNFAANTLTFTGSAGSNTSIALRVLSDGVLSFEGGAGQLFSIANSLVGQIFAVNDISGIPSLEVYSNGQVNIARFGGNVSIGTSTSTITVNGAVTLGNTLTIANNLSVTGFVNATASVNSAVLSVGTSFIANTTGAYHTGTINAASHTVSTNFIANSTGITTTGFANVATTISVGANVIANTIAVFVGNSTVNTVITQNTLQVANATGTSLFVAANGNVGVGNSTPGSKLVVAGNVRLDNGLSVGGTNVLQVDSNGIVGGRFVITIDPTANGTNGSPNSNVGIGNTAPAHKLRVEGNVSISSSLNVATTFASGNATITGFANVSGNLQVADTIAGNNMTLSGNLTVSGTTTYINTTNLNIGDNIITLNADLGAVAPTENAGFEVNRGTSANVSFTWDETNDRWTFGGDGANNTVYQSSSSLVRTSFINSAGMWDYFGNTTSTNAFAEFSIFNGVNRLDNRTRNYLLANSSANNVIFAANGNVGIGNMTPANKFNVQATSNTQVILSFLENNDTGTGAVAIQRFTAGTDKSLTLYAAGGGYSGMYGSATAPTHYYDFDTHSFRTIAGTTQLYIASNTNVGIGNVTPTSALVVERNADSNNPTILVRNTTTGTGALTTVRVTGDTVGAQLDFGVASNTYGGYGLIGANSAFILSKSVNGLGIFADNASSYLRFGAGGTSEHMRLGANGNFGIGTTTPYDKLLVAHNSNTQGTATFFNANNDTTAKSIITLAANTTSMVLYQNAPNSTSGEWGMYSGSATMFKVSTNAVSRFVISANGNVGIGNSTPAHLLRVEANTSINGTIFVTALDIGTNMFVSNSGGNMVVNFDSNDYLTYNKTNNQLTFLIGGNSVLLSNTTNLQVNSAANVTGTLTHGGLVMSTGTGIDQIYTATPSLTLNTNWQSTGVTSTNLANGTYVVQLLANDVAAGGTANNEYYSGMMSWYSADTNSTILDEIPLHRAGVNGSNNAIFLATQRTATANTSDLILMISSAANNSSSSTYTLKFRRMI